VLQAESRRLGAALTVDDLEECMDERWKIKKMKNGGDMNDDEEVALSGFSGKCFKCGKLGHKASDCKKKNQSQSQQKSKKFDGSCNNCGKYGHKAVNCWLDERNKDKRPRGFRLKSEQESGAAAIESTQPEFLLSSIANLGMEFPDKLNKPHDTAHCRID